MFLLPGILVKTKSTTHTHTHHFFVKRKHVFYFLTVFFYKNGKSFFSFFPLENRRAFFAFLRTSLKKCQKCKNDGFKIKVKIKNCQFTFFVTRLTKNPILNFFKKSFRIDDLKFTPTFDVKNLGI